MILGTAAFTVFLFKSKTKKAAARIFVVLILAVSVLNNICAMKEFKSNYERKPELVNQAIAVNEYLNENVSGTVLVITLGYEPVFDSYLTGTVYWTKKEDALKLLGDRDFIDLTQQKIISNYPFLEYTDLNEVDYIITDTYLGVDGTKFEKIMLKDVSDFSVFKNNDVTKLYLQH